MPRCLLFDRKGRGSTRTDPGHIQYDSRELCFRPWPSLGCAVCRATLTRVVTQRTPGGSASVPFLVSSHGQPPPCTDAVHAAARCRNWGRGLRVPGRGAAAVGVRGLPSCKVGSVAGSPSPNVVRSRGIWGCGQWEVRALSPGEPSQELMRPPKAPDLVQLHPRRPPRKHPRPRPNKDQGVPAQRPAFLWHWRWQGKGNETRHRHPLVRTDTPQPGEGTVNAWQPPGPRRRAQRNSKWCSTVR